MTPSTVDRLLGGEQIPWRYASSGQPAVAGYYTFRSPHFYSVYPTGDTRLVTTGTCLAEAEERMHLVVDAYFRGKNWKEPVPTEIVQLINGGFGSARFRKQDGTQLILLTERFGPAGTPGAYYLWNGQFDNPQFQPVQVQWTVKE